MREFNAKTGTACRAPTPFRAIIASLMVLAEAEAVAGRAEEAEAPERSASSALSPDVPLVGLAPWPDPQMHPLC